MGPCVRRVDKKNHGIAKRSVFPPPVISTAAKPVTARPRVLQSPCSLTSNLLSRVQSCVVAAPVQRTILQLDGAVLAVDGFGKAEDLFGLADHVGCRHLPGSMRYQPRLTTVFPSSVATAAMILCGVSLHQVSPVADGACTASIMVVKKPGDCAASAPSPRLFRNAFQRSLGLRAVDAVDRGRVIACDHQQPLNAGEPRLFIVIFGIFGEIGDKVAVVGLRRIDLREWRWRLAGAALARGGDDEIFRRDAQRIAAALRDRRGAIEAERARIEQDAVGGQRALRHHAAGGGNRCGTSRASRSPPCRRCRSRPRPHSSCGCRVSGRQKPARRKTGTRSSPPAAPAPCASHTAASARESCA